MDNEKTAVYELEIPSTEFISDSILCDTVIQFSYTRDGFDYRSGLRFLGVEATRTRVERCCTAWYIDGAYDTLVEIVDSPWLRELSNDTEEKSRPPYGLHHYMIYLENSGCFELIANAWSVLPPTQGAWPTRIEWR